METIGWIGSLMLAACAAPEVLSSYRTKKCSLTWGFLILWLVGEVLTGIPVFLHIQEPYLMFNYAANIVMISYLVYIKRRSNG